MSEQDAVAADNAMQIINNAYRQGATIWHNLEEIGNFDLDNRIV